MASSSSSIPPFQIKICGIRTLEEAEVVVASHADAVGLNFFERSKRFVSLEQAKPIADAVKKSGVKVVGLFVNSPIQVVESTSQQVGLDIVQLHGDEGQNFIDSVRQRLPDIKIVKAIRLPADGSIRLIDFLMQGNWRVAPDAWLVDAGVPGEFGGTGKIGAWEAIELTNGQVRLPEDSQEAASLLAPVILAGGLTPMNVLKAILQVRPAGVDVASGVENELGVKDPTRSLQFVANAKKAFEMVRINRLKI